MLRVAIVLSMMGIVVAMSVSFHLENKVSVKAFKCIAHDKKFAKIVYCELKPVNRTLKYISARITLFKTPPRQSQVNFAFQKKANGYKPFPINITFNGCDYFAGRSQRAFQWYFDLLVPHSNMNHTCPYVGDIIIDKLPLEYLKLPSIFPDGEYRLTVTVLLQRIRRLSFITDLVITENSKRN